MPIPHSLLCLLACPDEVMKLCTVGKARRFLDLVILRLDKVVKYPAALEEILHGLLNNIPNIAILRGSVPYRVTNILTTISTIDVVIDDEVAKPLLRKLVACLLLEPSLMFEEVPLVVMRDFEKDSYFKVIFEVGNLPFSFSLEVWKDIPKFKLCIAGTEFCISEI